MKRSVAQKIFRVKPVLTVCEIEKLLVARHGTRICQRIKEVVVGVRKVENYCKIIRRTYAFHRRKQRRVGGTGLLRESSLNAEFKVLRLYGYIKRILVIFAEHSLVPRKHSPMRIVAKLKRICKAVV